MFFLFAQDPVLNIVNTPTSHLFTLRNIRVYRQGIFLSNDSRPKRGVLLASFIPSADENRIISEIEHIAATVELTNNLIFLLSLPDDPDRKIITYNAVLERGRPLNSRLFTMRVHRKKVSNTLYTINALNAAVALENNGETGRHLKLNWDNYQNSIMLLTGRDLKVHKVEVLKIFKLEDAPEEE